MTIYNQILYVTSFSATFSLLGLLSAGQLMPAIRWGGRGVDACCVLHAVAIASRLLSSVCRSCVPSI